MRTLYPLDEVKQLQQSTHYCYLLGIRENYGVFYHFLNIKIIYSFLSVPDAFASNMINDDI